MSKKPNKFKNLVLLFMKHFTMAQVSASSAVLAYYTLLSVFPAIIVVGNLLPMLGLDAKTVLDYLQVAVPSSVYKFLYPIVYDFLKNGSGGALTIGAIVALWSTSSGIAAFQRSVNHAYGVAENQNPIINRVASFIWMLIILIILLAIVLLYGLGEQVLESLQSIFGFSTEYIRIFNSYKLPVTFLGLFIMLALLYYFVPNAAVKFRYVLLGTLTADLLWMGLSRVFSYYTRIFAHNITSYSTIGAFIVLMIWLDLSGTIVMIGATINATLQDAREGEIHEKKHLWKYLRNLRKKEFDERYGLDDDQIKKH